MINIVNKVKIEFLKLFFKNFTNSIMTRFLSSAEIEDILNFIKPNKHIPLDTALSIVKINKDKLRNQLVKQEIYPELIPELKKIIQQTYQKSLIDAGESVGIISAQSIGERQTQNTLNSIDWNDKILILDKTTKQSIVEPIGKFIDNLILNNKEKIEFIPENRTEYLDIQNYNYYIPSCDENGYMDWYKIEAITKHLPVGKLVKVKTESGREVTATQSKSFLVWNEIEKKFIATQGSDIKIGDILPTTQILPKHSIITEYIEYKDYKIKLDKETGFIIGLFLTNNIDKLLLEVDIKNKYDNWCTDYIFGIEFILNITENNTIIPNFIFTSSNDCIKSFLSGYFRNCIYNDGNIEVYSNKYIISGINFLLTYFKVFGNIENNKIIINNKNTKIFEKEVIEEFWKDIHPDFLLSNYQISNLGRVKNKKTNYISQIKPRKDTNTVQYSLINNDSKQKVYYGNILVCKTFIPNIYDKNCVNHINRIKDDNRISNLRWATFSESSKNKIHKYKKGKKIDQYDLEGNFIKTWDKIVDVEKILKISHSNILAVINGRKKQTSGFVWKYNIEKIENEIWKKVPIEDIEETYVSNFGRVKRRNEDHTITYGTSRKDGYYNISLPLKKSIEERKNNKNIRIKTKIFSVHRLIGITFIENVENKEYINHIDKNRQNNKLSNLEWCTNSENILHSLKTKNIEYVTNNYEISEEEKIYDVYFDKVVNIEYVNGTTDYVYDLTVEKTRNFQLFNGLNVRDTLLRGK